MSKHQLIDGAAYLSLVLSVVRVLWPEFAEVVRMIWRDFSAAVSTLWLQLSPLRSAAWVVLVNVVSLLTRGRNP